MRRMRSILSRMGVMLRLFAAALLVYAAAYAAHYVGDASNPSLDPPVSSQFAWSYEGFASSQLGTSLSAGDITGDGFSDILVGSPYQYTFDTWGGMIFIFTGSSAGASAAPLQERTKTERDAAYGFSVSVVGDVNGDGFADAAVGAPLLNVAGVDEGRIFFYLGSEAGLGLENEWSYAGSQAGEQCGYCVAGAGDVNGDGYMDVIAGAPYYDGAGGASIDGGRALLFLGSSNGLQPQPAWIVEGSQARCRFGMSVAGAGDVNRDGYGDVIVGAPFWDGAAADEGAVFVYLGSPSGLALEPAWSVNGGLGDCRFGNAVSTAGDVDGDGFSDVLIGASYYYTAFRERNGRAFVYRGSQGGLEAEPYWEQTWGYLEHFGLSVAAAGDVDGNGLSDILVGSLTIQTTLSREYAYLFLSSETGISTTPDWRARDDVASNIRNVGIVSSAGDVNGDGFCDVLVGDYLYGSTDAGRALVYHAVPTRAILTQTPERSLARSEPGAWFGASVAGSGDVNGDGRVDVIVGAPFRDGSAPQGGSGFGGLQGGFSGSRSGDLRVASELGLEDAGAAFLYAGSDSGFGATPLWSAEGDALWGWFGFSASFAGDLNGDGFDDVIVGAPRYSNGEADEGAAYLYFGSSDGPAETASWIGEGGQEGAEYGFSVARAGDVNGDGYSDIIIGAFRHSNGFEEEGRAYVYYGSPVAPFILRRWTAEGGQEGAWFGYAVSGAGDINGDGYSDVMVGAPYYDNGETDEGRVFLYAGSKDGLPGAPTWTIEIDREISRLGIAVSPAGDVNGDGYGDIVIGAEGYLFELEDIGSVFLYYGSPEGPLPEPAWSARGDPLLGGLGKSVAAGGDLNCDGFSDVVIGDPFYDGVYMDQGRVVVFTGSERGLPEYPPWVLEGTQTDGWFGYAVSSVGDVNGDGAPDVFVGAPRRSESDGGGAGFIYTTSGLSRDRLLPRQRRSDGSAQVSLLGYSGNRETLRLAASSRVPAGATAIFLEYEFKPDYLPFDAANIGRGSPRRLTPAERASRDPIELAETIDPPGTPERGHWRVRVCTDVPYAPHGRWASHSYNTTAEADIRLWVNSVDESPENDRPEASGSLVLHLGTNFPNPCNPASVITYSTSRPLFVTLGIYDVLGRCVRTLVEDWRDAGEYQAAWDGRNALGEPLASGIYFLRLEAGGTVRARKIAVLR